VDHKQMKAMAAVEPDRLVALLPALGEVDLTFAAECLKEVPWDVAGPALLRLLQHKQAIVREGALYGLAGHSEREDVREAVREALSDDAPGIRAAAEEWLEWNVEP
jgi:hypothetical protein